MARMAQKEAILKQKRVKKSDQLSKIKDQLRAKGIKGKLSNEDVEAAAKGGNRKRPNDIAKKFNQNKGGKQGNAGGKKKVSFK